MAAESCRDEPEGREAVGIPLPPGNLATGAVRSVQATPSEGVADVHRAAAIVAGLYSLIVREALAPATSAYRLLEIGRLVARDGMRASRLLRKASKEVR